MQRLLPLAVLAVAPAVGAQVDHFTTSPQGYEYVEGGSDSRDLLGTEPRLRYQQIDATNTRTLASRDRVAFRRDGWLFDNPAYGPRTIELELVLGESNLKTISTTFATNYRANTAVAVARKFISFQDWSLRPAVPPATETNVILLDQQWSYLGKVATGNDLLWEVRVFSNSQAGQDYPFDFDYVVPNATFGPVTPSSSTNLVLSPGCVVGGTRQVLWPAVLNHGTKFELVATSAQGPLGMPHFLLLDAQDLALSLPALCNPLHALAATLPMGVSNPIGEASVQLNFAHNPWLIGRDLYLQAAAPDLGRPGIQVSLSSGVQVAVPPDPPTPAIGRVWALDPTAATATVGPVAGGIILYTNHV